MEEDRFYVVACPVNPTGPFVLVEEGKLVSYYRATEITNKISSVGFYRPGILPEKEAEEMRIEEFEIVSLEDILIKSQEMLEKSRDFSNLDRDDRKAEEK